MVQNRLVSDSIDNFSDMHSKLTDEVESALDKADRFATENIARMNHEEVFGKLRRKSI